MIIAYMTRDNGSLFHDDRAYTPLNALISLAKWELGYGANVVDISPTTVKVQTCLLGCVDTTTFAGTEDDMKKLVLVVSLYVKVKHHGLEGMAKRAWEVVQNKTALVITGLGPMLIGKQATLVAVCAAYNAPLESLELLRSMDLADVITALELREETGEELQTICG
jgi:hypothetical protein